MEKISSDSQIVNAPQGTPSYSPSLSHSSHNDKQSPSGSPRREHNPDQDTNSIHSSSDLKLKDHIPPLSPKSVQLEEPEEAKKPVKSKKTKKYQDEEQARVGVEELLVKIAAAIEDDKNSILNKQAGQLISPKEAVPPPGNRIPTQKYFLCRTVSPRKRPRSPWEYAMQAPQRLPT